MIASLPLFHRVAGQPVIVLGSGEGADAKRRLITRAGGVICDSLADGIANGARLAFIAHEDGALAQADSELAREAGLLVNATDRPDLCDFTVPSVLDRAPVLIAIGTGGASAGLAKQIRLRLEALLPRSLGALATSLFAQRASVRARWPDAGDRRRALDSALAEGGALDPLVDAPAGRVENWIASAAQAEFGSQFEINLRTHDPEDLTLREMRQLGAADLILHDQNVPPEILNRARADAPRAVLGQNDVSHTSSRLTVIIRSAHSGA